MKIAKGIQISKPPILLPFLSSQSHKMHSNTQSADLCDGRGSLPVLVDIEDSLPNLPPIYTNPQHQAIVTMIALSSPKSVLRVNISQRMEFFEMCCVG